MVSSHQPIPNEPLIICFNDTVPGKGKWDNNNAPRKLKARQRFQEFAKIFQKFEAKKLLQIR